MEALIPIVIQVVAGILGGGGIAGALKGVDMGKTGNLIAGALGGLGGGSILGMLGGAGAGAAVGDVAGGGMIGDLIGSAVGGGAGGHHIVHQQDPLIRQLRPVFFRHLEHN